MPRLVGLLTALGLIRNAERHDRIDDDAPPDWQSERDAHAWLGWILLASMALSACALARGTVAPRGRRAERSVERKNEARPGRRSRRRDAGNAFAPTPEPRVAGTAATRR